MQGESTTINRSATAGVVRGQIDRWIEERRQGLRARAGLGTSPLDALLQKREDTQTDDGEAVEAFLETDEGRRVLAARLEDLLKPAQIGAGPSIEELLKTEEGRALLKAQLDYAAKAASVASSPSPGSGVPEAGAAVQPGTTGDSE